jgi:hypothetical protein
MSGLTPVNLSVADAQAAAKVNGNVETPQPPTVDELSNWSQEAYSLDVNTATTLGFPLGNIGATYRRQALMFGVSRWKDLAASGETYRFGVALRAVIVVSDLRGPINLTLPVVAAKVELDGARATAQLLVRGYKGKTLGEALPQWQTFGVDAYAQYMKSVSDIQKLIMEDEENIVPELLATTLISSSVPPATAAVGTVYALHAISEGASQAHAADTIKTDSPEIISMVRKVYESIVGQDERAVPSDDDRTSAEAQLAGLHLSSGFFHR